MENTPEQNSKIILRVLLGFSLAFIIASLFAGNLSQLIPGFVTIITRPSQLTMDYLKLGGVGGCFLNVGMVGLSCWAICVLSGAKANGATVAGYFLSVGFASFGLNFVNIWPFFLGVFIYSRVKKVTFASVANLAMFSTALAPFASEMLFRYPNADPTGFSFVGLLLALLVGIVGGMAMPSVCAHTVNFHKGYDLYNAGPAAGFIGMVFFCLMYKNRGIDAPKNTDIGDGAMLFVVGFAVIVFLICLIAGWIMNGKSFKGYGALLKDSGHKADFLAKYGAPVTLINFGVYGLFIVAYYVIVGGKFTGPTMGSIFCMLAFVAAGTHPLNVLPIMLGYVAMSFFASWELTTQAILVGVCFASGLAPVSGKWGVIPGIIAGMIHSAIVMSVVGIHGGFCLYNGGFTSGIVAFVLIPVLECFFKDKETRMAEKSAPAKDTAA